MKTFLTSIGLSLLLVACNARPAASNRLQVSASFYPLAFLAQQIGGEFVAVSQITPHGVEPHDYEPTPGDIRKLEQSKTFLMNGSGVDSWADALAPELRTQNVSVFVLTEGVTLLSASDDGHDHEAEEAADGDAGTDPHVWLDPIILRDNVDHIATLFTEQDPEHARAYEANAAMLKAKLADYDRKFALGLSQCEKSEIVASHNAYAYLAQRYGFTVHALAGLSPEDEPSPGRMLDLAREAEEEGIDVIFFETLVSPKLAETIAQEVGARTAVLNPLEGLTSEQVVAGDDYFSVMLQNLAMLHSALVCPNPL